MVVVLWGIPSSTLCSLSYIDDLRLIVIELAHVDGHPALLLRAQTITGRRGWSVYAADHGILDKNTVQESDEDSNVDKTGRTTVVRGLTSSVPRYLTYECTTEK